ncbi:hypothetical protein ACRALDRAFT_1075186 [Sodiomyces alcalophilus JCM 7366]|uniref:uncharacterized protein n=1 Tax=Sodiomyces alcalophilus JCM 7366 TaxID=591952 RepID=UPI0039B4C39A
MAPSTKVSVTRPKSTKDLIVTFHVAPEKLKHIFGLLLPAKESPPAQRTPEVNEKPEVKEPVVNGSTDSPTPSTTLPGTAASTGENASDSNPATPLVNGEGTPAPGTTMGPPTDGLKKKGTKRSAAAANGVGSDGQAKSRGRPGPKKKARLDDGTETNGTGRGGGSHRLGPKANQGAINAGLRALDRSGKPCRKWSRGGFQVKSFTGVTWEIRRWTAPPKPAPEPEPAPVADDSAAASADSSAKENKENASQVKSDVNSPVPADSAAASSADAETQSGGLENGIDTSSPGPVPIPAT